MVRRAVAVVAAVVLLTEAVGIVVINGILATFVDGQSMSLDGLDPDAMVIGTWVTGGVLGLALGACAVVSLVAGVRDRAPGRLARALLIGAAVLHGLLGAVTLGLVGWYAFGFLMVVLGLIVLVLISYGKYGTYGKHGKPGSPDGPAAAPKVPGPPSGVAPGPAGGVAPGPANRVAPGSTGGVAPV
ncbi:hypothetical protein ACWF94_20645 [Streptomyces sp. NPDC055078]